MKIKNHTRWDTTCIRAMVGWVLADRGVSGKGLLVDVRPGRRGSVRAWPGGDTILLRVPNPAAPFVADDDHIERVTDFARRIDWAVCVIRRGGEASLETQSLERPLVWLADWYEVNRGRSIGAVLEGKPAHGMRAGCPPSPLMPAREGPSKAEQRAKELAHAQAMLRKAVTRKRRAETIVKKWVRKVVRLERLSKA